MPIMKVLLSLLFGLGGTWVFWRLLATLKGTLGWALSGEPGSLLVRGFTSRGRRFRRTVEMQAIVTHTAVAARVNLPLPQALRAAAQGETGWMQQALDSIADAISAGTPLSEAFRRAIPGCPPLMVAILRQGERCGQSARALTNVEEMLADRFRATPPWSRHAVTYAAVMFLGGMFIVSGIMIFVVPKFKCIFEDFDADLPPMTVQLIGISDWFFNGATPPFLIGLALALGAGLIALVVERLGRSETPGPFTGAVGKLRWACPWTRQLDRGLGMATAIRTMAAGVEAGVPLDQACQLAPTVAVTNHLHWRLKDFAQRVREGEMPHQAARAAALGDVFVAVLRMIERGERADQSLAHAADYYQAIAHRWWHALSALSVPVVTLLCAVTVGFIALAMFLPLIQLINSVADTIV